MRIWLLLHGFLSLATVCGGKIYFSTTIKPFGFQARCTDGREMDFVLPINLSVEDTAQAALNITYNFCARGTL